MQYDDVTYILRRHRQIRPFVVALQGMPQSRRLDEIVQMTGGADLSEGERFD